MKKIFTNYVLLFWLLLAGQLHSQVWEPVGAATGISAGAVGRLKILSDNNDKLIVGYQDVENSSVGSVQKFDGTSWSYLGGQPGLAADFAVYNSIAVDSQGTLYFTNQAGWPETGLKGKKFQNNVWSNLPDATNASINYNTSTLSPEGVLYVASGENSGTIKKLINGVWQQVGSSGFFNGAAFYLDMVVGSNGKIYVSFNNDDQVHVYMNDINAGSTDAWQPVGGSSNLVASINSENYNSSLAIDSNNNIYIAYISPSSKGNKLNVKKFNGISWSQLGNENFSQTRVQYVSLEIDKNNEIYVASSIWEDDNNLKNYVSTYDVTSGSWKKVGTGFVSQGQATFNSLSTDNVGNLYLAFMDSGLSKLSVKKLNRELVATESIMISTEGGAAPEINIDNGTLQLNATVFPQTANQNVIWSIEEGGTFATVSNTGLVTAIASNTTVIVKAVSAQNSSISKTFNVVIKNQDSDIDAQSVTIKTANGGYPDIFAIGNTLQLKATVSPAEADQKIIWSVAQGASVVNVNSNGLVTALAEGMSIVRATHIDGSIYGEINVSVYKNGCSQGNNTANTGFGYSISESSNGADDFIVPAGTRFSVSKLRLNIIASSPESLSFNVNFLKNDNGIPGEVIKQVVNINPTSLKIINDLEFGQYQYEAELNFPEPIVFDEGTYWLNPVAISEQEIYWDTTPLGGIGSDYHFDNFDGNGWRKLGNGGFNGVFEITGNCTPMPIVINTMNGSDATVFIGESLQLKATVNAQGISQNIVWTIENGVDSAAVNENGIVIGLRAGKAIIKATSIDNANISGTLEVTVLDADACSREAVSNDIEDAYSLNGDTEQRLAVDFEVAGSSFTIDSVEPSVANFAKSFNFIIYKDENGFPGEEIASSNGQIIHDIVTGSQFDFYFHRYKVKLDSPITLPTGKYWMEMQGDALAWEATSADIQGNYGAFFNNVTNTWSYLDAEFVYKINGVCETLGTNEVDNTAKLSYYPNPVTDHLNLNSDKVINKITIFNLAGQLISTFDINGKDAKVNLITLPSGIYIINAILNNKDVKTFKIIKK